RSGRRDAPNPKVKRSRGRYASQAVQVYRGRQEIQPRGRYSRVEFAILVPATRGHPMTDDHAHDADPVPTGVELPPPDEPFRVNPHPVLARLRAREPVHYDQVINRWVLTRSDDVESVL